MAPKYRRVSVDELFKQHMRGADHVVLIGMQGSGKSTLAHALAKAGGYVRFNGDDLRAELFGDAGNHDNEELVYSTLKSRVATAVSSGARTLTDMTNLTEKGRAWLLDILREHRKQPHYLLLDVPLEVCLERNRLRDRFVPEGIIISAGRALRVNGLPSLADGAKLTVVRQSDEIGTYLLIPKGETPDVMRAGGEPLYGSRFDIIGDVHGCYYELLDLLEKLGYRISFLEPAAGKPVRINEVICPEGRKLVFVGDLMDRGPHSDLVLALSMGLLYKQAAQYTSGNHCNKLMRVLKGNPIKMKDDLAATVASINQHGERFREQVLKFLIGTPVRLENRQLIVVHAAYRKGVSATYAEKLALIGEVDGSRDEHGFPVRLENWEREYDGGKTIVHGHVPVPEVIDRKYPGGRVINIDTSCCFGGKLTALRFPEMEYVSVPARREYSARHGHGEE